MKGLQRVVVVAENVEGFVYEQGVVRVSTRGLLIQQIYD